MNKAPKILWYDDQECAAGPVQFNSDEVKYVRADLVDGLAKALEKLVKADFGYDGWTPELDQSALQIRAALKALESAEIGRGME
jgi:hypothetical protein